MAGARRRGRIKTSRRDFRPQALDNVVRLPHMGAASSAFALASGFLGLLVSYHLDLPSGPAIVLVAGLAYLASVVLGPRDSVRALYMRRAQLEA